MLRTVAVFIAFSFTLQTSAYASDTGTVRLIQSSKFLTSKTFKLLPIDRQKLTLSISDCPALFSDLLKNAGRQVMENIIICQALKEFGHFNKIQYVLSGNTDRQRLDVVNNKGDMLGHSTSEFALNNNNFYRKSDFIISRPVIHKDQIDYWIFTSKNQLKEVKETLDSNDLSKLIGISMLSWRGVLQAMQALNLNSVRRVTDPDKISMYLEAKRANITLSTKNSATINRGGELKRVEGYRIANEYNRVFSFNKSSLAVAQAISRYLTKMRLDGDKITHAFRHAGYLRNKNKNWTVISSLRPVDDLASGG